MTLRTFAFAELRLSPLNVRLNKEDAEATDALEASILAHGLLFPLVVHPLGAVSKSAHGSGRDGVANGFGVLAGGRRFRAIGKLIARGELPDEFPIDAVVRDLPDAEITEISLAENLLRRELRPYEVHAAIARAAGQGASAEDIAARTGQRVEWVRQQLRLGTLAPEIFDAYAEERLSLEQARAYAATEDRELQLTAWRHFKGRPDYEHRAHGIRAFLKIGDRELEALLRFVGVDAYRAAGGRFELDLFADGPDERGRVVDESVLRQIAEAKLEETRERLRARTGRKDLRFSKEPPQNAGTTDWALKIEPEYRGKHKIALPAGDVLATLTIDGGGEVEVGYWWASRKEKTSAARAATHARLSGEELGDTPVSRGPSIARGGHVIADGDAFDSSANYSYAQAARAFVKEEHGLTADGLQVVRSERRAILRAILLLDADEHGSLGRDYLVWSQLRQEFGSDRWPVTGARGLSSAWGGADDAEPHDVVKPFLEETKAHVSFRSAVADLATEPFMKEEDPAESLSLYLALDEETKNIFAALLAGAALIRSANVPGWRVKAHDRLVEHAQFDDVTIRACSYWKPTPAFLGLLPRLKRLELAQPHVDPDAFRSWHKQDDKTITGACTGALDQAEGWVHPLLSFNVARAPDDEAHPESEPDPNVNDLGVEPARILVTAP